MIFGKIFNCKSHSNKKYGSEAILIFIVLGFFFYILNKKEICRGLILGSLSSTINFIIIRYSLYLNIRKDKSKKILHSFYSILFRYFIIGLSLTIGIKFEKFNLFGIVIGLFAVQISILIDYLYYFFYPDIIKQGQNIIWKS